MPNGQQHGGSRGGRDEQGFEQRNQRSQRPPQRYREEQQQDQRTAGGRSEAYARQRDNEQMRAGYGRDEWAQRPPTRTVRSEPHWDPTASRGSWDPGGSHAGMHGNWEDDRYYGSPAYERSSYEERSTFDNRDRDRERSARDFEGQGFGQSYRGQEHEESLGQQLQEAGRRLIGKVKRIVRNPKNYTRSDERIREDVCDRLAVSAEVDPSELEVTVTNGEVTLTGVVLNRQMKFQAEEIADDVAGVHEVHNQLRVRREQQPTGSAQASSTSDAQRNRTIGRS